MFWWTTADRAYTTTLIWNTQQNMRFLYPFDTLCHNVGQIHESDLYTVKLSDRRVPLWYAPVQLMLWNIMLQRILWHAWGM